LNTPDGSVTLVELTASVVGILASGISTKAANRFLREKVNQKRFGAKHRSDKNSEKL
jgi:hypothetical protein